VEQDNEERAFFSTAEVHQQILEANLAKGDTFSIKKVTLRNGKKTATTFEFGVVNKQILQPPKTNGEDDFRDVMEKCLRDAVACTQAVNGLPWQTHDVRSLAVTLFIQRVGR
jgi:hypothetical protein